MCLTIIILLGRDSREIFSSELRYLVDYLLVVCQYLTLIKVNIITCQYVSSLTTV